MTGRRRARLRDPREEVKREAARRSRGASAPSARPGLRDLRARSSRSRSRTSPGGSRGRRRRGRALQVPRGRAWFAGQSSQASNGSVNSMHDSFTPLGGLVPMWLMQLGEVVYGGVGSGLYGMLVFAIIAVFVAGLMVGRTPEYLGKKIEAYEMKMAALVILIPPAVVLIGAAVAVMTPGGRAGVESRSARVQRGAVCLLLGGQQQRERLRRPRRQHALLQHRPGVGDALRSLLARRPDPGDRRIPGAEEDRPGQRGDAPHAHAACLWCS